MILRARLFPATVTDTLRVTQASIMALAARGLILTPQAILWTPLVIPIVSLLPVEITISAWLLGVNSLYLIIVVLATFLFVYVL